SVATLGRHNAVDLESHLATEVQRLQQATVGPRCCVLESGADCSTCESPLPAEVRRRFTLTREGDTITIARVTCPTAPKFWRWRELSWPKLVPRQVLLEDEETHLHEWKKQLVAAMLCGVLGVLAYW